MNKILSQWFQNLHVEYSCYHLINFNNLFSMIDNFTWRIRKKISVKEFKSESIRYQIVEHDDSTNQQHKDYHVDRKTNPASS